MPPRKGRRCQLREPDVELHPNLESQLLFGVGFWESPLTSTEDFRAAWDRWGKQVVARLSPDHKSRIYACDLLGLPQPARR